MFWWRVILVLVLTAAKWGSTSLQSQPEWVVYELSSGSGRGDAVTRLSAQLAETQTSTDPVARLSTFTLCIWFRVTAFLKMPTVLSYAVSDTVDDAIRIRAYPDELRVTYMMGKSTALDAVISPVRWHPTCLVVEPNRLVIWLEGRNLTVDAPTPPLPLSGHLVIGQEQDEWDGGYTPSQSFLGQVTGLTIWDIALEATQMHAWSLCEPTNTSAFISWPQINWTLHNQTGHLKVSPSMPCSKHDDLLLFTLSMTWSEALDYLHRIGLEMAVPRSHEEIAFLSQRIRENGQFCSLEFKLGSYGWIGTKANASGRVENVRGEEFEVENATWKETSESRSSLYMILDDSGQLELRSDFAVCFAARQQRPAVFRLRGLCERGRDRLASMLEAGFVLNSEGASGIHFHGFGHLSITREGTTSLWCLRESGPPDGASSEIVCTSSQFLPLGPRKWTFRQDVCQGEANASVELVLTRCADDQHTCPDATCIALSRRCDFAFDCSDRTDESGCSTARRHEGYVRALPPSIPLDIKAHVYFVAIREFDLLSMTFGVRMKVTLVWYDPWLTFLHLASAEEREVVVAEGQEVWTPLLEVTNSVESRGAVAGLRVRREAEGSASLAGYTYKGSENPLVLELDLRSTVSCQFQLHLYPWDEQECEVNMTVTNVAPGRVNVSRDSQVVHCPTILDQYHVRDCSLRKGTLTLSLHLFRRYEYHLWTTYLPTYLLQLLGYWSLYLPVDNFNERGTMSLTTLLVLISLYTETSSSLPSTAYLKHIDVWFVFNICFLTLIIGIHLATCSSISEGTGSNYQSTGPLFLPRSPVKNRDKSSKLSCKNGKDLTDPAFVLGVSRVMCAIISAVFSAIYFWLIW